MDRRNFVALAAGIPALATTAPAAGAQRAVSEIPTRKCGKVEIAFHSPGPKPNGLQATKEGLWIIDQGDGNKAYLMSYDGKVIRSFATETTKSSGITFDGASLWIGSTYSREIVRVDAQSGKTLERHFTPGAGINYQMKGDPAQRASPFAQKTPVDSKKPQDMSGFQMGKLLGAAAPGTGAHGQEWRDGKLWYSVPPSREVYCIEPATWIVQNRFPTSGNRPHGIGWEGKYLWVADSNLNAFFKHDPDTGAVLEKIQLADSDPLPHGMTIWQGSMWYCDDVGLICRLKM